MKLGRFEYQMTVLGSTTVLVMNKAVAELVADALDIISPDNPLAERIAKQVAVGIRPE